MKAAGVFYLACGGLIASCSVEPRPEPSAFEERLLAVRGHEKASSVFNLKELQFVCFTHGYVSGDDHILWLRHLGYLSAVGTGSFPDPVPEPEHGFFAIASDGSAEMFKFDFARTSVTNIDDICFHAQEAEFVRSRDGLKLVGRAVVEGQ